MPAFGKGRVPPANSSISSAALTTGYRSERGPSDTWKERSRSSNSEPGSSVSRKIRSTFARAPVRLGTMIPICAAGFCSRIRRAQAAAARISAALSRSIQRSGSDWWRCVSISAHSPKPAKKSDCCGVSSSKPARNNFAGLGRSPAFTRLPTTSGSRAVSSQLFAAQRSRKARAHDAKAAQSSLDSNRPSSGRR